MSNTSNPVFSSSLAQWALQWCATLSPQLEQLHIADQQNDLIQAFVSIQITYQQLDTQQLWQPLYSSDILLSETSTFDTPLNAHQMSEQEQYEALLYFTLCQIAQNKCIERIFYPSYHQNYPNVLVTLENPSDFVFLCFKAHSLFGHRSELIAQGAYLWNYFHSQYEQQLLEQTAPIVSPPASYLQTL